MNLILYGFFEHRIGFRWAFFSALYWLLVWGSKIKRTIAVLLFFFFTRPAHVVTGFSSGFILILIRWPDVPKLPWPAIPFKKKKITHLLSWKSAFFVLFLFYFGDNNSSAQDLLLATYSWLCSQGALLVGPRGQYWMLGSEAKSPACCIIIPLAPTFFECKQQKVPPSCTQDYCHSGLFHYSYKAVLPTVVNTMLDS